MKIEKYGIVLKRLTIGDIELLRKKRNQKSIKSKMFFQKEISKAEQQEWFQSINNKHHYYFIIYYKNKEIGLIHGKILSFEKRLAEGGMFIWEEELLQSHIPVLASIILADMTFLIMKMKTTLAEVRSDNPTALSYNLKLGYKITESISAKNKTKMSLQKKDYFEKAKPLRDMIKRISKDSTDISWADVHLENSVPDSLYTGLPDYLQEEIEKKRSNFA
ncbi:hypothetical protein [Haloflavibacter putidus]|uniref:N-acetyltransferase domain-containing protein n=1 Tax=Haloflavibacter putidus TaxID=2576776 RepID=A0A507ZVT7_9FLAO|nr:hypothetical protein [Haloflavibacter putidus]TQD37712.1 hypothetical protein FKR84_09570 [Haloflavibacter putidus]